MTGALLSAIGVAFTLAGIAIAGFGAWRSSKENAEWRNKVDAKNDQLLAKDEELLEKGEQLRLAAEEHAAVLIAKANESAAKSERIAELTGELRAYATGADSFFYLHIRDFGLPSHTASLRIVGKYPVRDTQITVFDVTDQFANVASGAQLDLQEAASKRITVDIAYPQHSKKLTRFPFEASPSKESYAYFINITNAGGEYQQIVHLVKVRDVWKQAYFVQRDAGDTKLDIIVRNVDDGYPKSGPHLNL